MAPAIVKQTANVSVKFTAMTVRKVWTHAAANTYSTSGSMVKCLIVFRSPHSAAAGVGALEDFLPRTAWFPA
ncbi:hypothetical protein G6F46_005495 [Rhizopus delemar]|nr:hypothetical protein G6F43_005330 [Rhizopus delemar]KAG1498865.1 hypothetical protein G6F54_004784 [Rhizopus delemar]KAG1512910.1 hypothetical protein G6F53_004829 [Rhizopus delemar]KAG1597835.1 hypothetical protein G6F47_006963 [Rhizopus delemar]KAG1616369.1 hypothetical protein G6F46_005495 [Rhizopus delemar]